MKQKMSQTLIALLLAIVICITTLQKSEGQMEEYCVADEQTPDKELEDALNWACEKGGADCRKIKENQACYLPNTLIDHASFVFNDYYQKFKHKGGSCYFNAAALVTALDPSHGSCKFDYVP